MLNAKYYSTHSTKWSDLINHIIAKRQIYAKENDVLKEYIIKCYRMFNLNLNNKSSELKYHNILLFVLDFNYPDSALEA